MAGFTLVEVVIAIIVVTLVIAGLIASYLVIQRNWQGGSKQIIVQGQGRLALNHICRHIREASNLGVSNLGRTLVIIRLDGGSLAYKYDEQSHTLNYYPDWSDQTSKEVLVNNLYKQPGNPIFLRSGSRKVYIHFRVIDVNQIDGYQGIDLSSSAYSRNM